MMGYTQEELGSKIGLQKSAIAKYENGRVENIKRSVITDMAQVLECSPGYLMGWEEQQTPRIEKTPKIIQYERTDIDITEEMKMSDEELLNE